MRITRAKSRVSFEVQKIGKLRISFRGNSLFS